MSTMMEDVGGAYRISTVVGPGKRKKAPRGGVFVRKDNKEAVTAEIIRQAEEARKALGVDQAP